MSSTHKYNPAIHNRQSIRLKGYDYSHPGAYFITICTQNRRCLFGEIIRGEMILNDPGTMVEKWYSEIENKYSGIICDDHITMPNHFHCIIKIPAAGVGRNGVPLADATVANTPPGTNECPHSEGRPRRDVPTWASFPNPTSVPIPSSIPNPTSIPNPSSVPIPSAIPNPTTIPAPSTTISSKPGIFQIMDWFKTMTTNEYIRGVKTRNWQRFEKRVWQLRYWDHIIRNEQELFAIQQYIKNNSSKWESDKLNGGTGNRVLEESIAYAEEPWMI